MEFLAVSLVHCDDALIAIKDLNLNKCIVYIWCILLSILLSIKLVWWL